MGRKVLDPGQELDRAGGTTQLRDRLTHRNQRSPQDRGPATNTKREFLTVTGWTIPTTATSIPM